MQQTVELDWCMGFAQQQASITLSLQDGRVIYRK